nr:DUF2974 domain-containing protein [Neobacillus sp. Marseille-Q6967]
MTFKDEELKLATDIAYLDLEMLNENMPYRKEPYSVAELLQIERDGEGNPKNEITEVYLNRLTENKDHFGDEHISIDDGKVNQLSSDALDWKIVDTFNDNNKDGSGFYGVVIDTGDGMIVSFRGSEVPTELQNIHQDWLKADLGLIKGQLTEQQLAANRFMDYLAEQDYIDKYDQMTFAGHSLGGNLAEHSTFYAASIGLADKIERTISYDGPGFSQEYLWQYKKDIEMALGTVQMDHVEQSLVGGLLQRVDGINYFYAKLTGTSAVQHGTEFVKFDDEGNIVIAEHPSQLSTVLSKYLVSPFTQGMERLVSPAAGAVMVTALVALTEAGWKLKDALYKEGKLTKAGEVVVATIAGSLLGISLALGPVGTGIAIAAATVALVKFAVVALVAAVVFVGAVILYDFVMDQIEAFVDYMVNEFIPKVLDKVTETVGKFVKWSKEQLVEFGNMLATGYKAFLDGLSHLFGAGPKIAATPHIKVDTYKLRSYADRLERVKARISAVDSDLNILYLTEGFLDLINLAIAENLPSKSQMNKVIDYLQDTATEFEAAEYRIMSI